jgi:dolichyl-phosphate-mannose--protein O-mannosyl transferase
MNPFGWRFMPAIAGILAVAAFYMVARRLFGRTGWASVAGLLFAFDFMHFAQSRMATVDVFVLLFVLLAFWCLLENERRPESRPWLLGAGLALGGGMATKWSAAYAVGAVVLLFAAGEWRRLRGNAEPGAAARAAVRSIVCLAVAPLVVYAASWLPSVVSPVGMSWAGVIERHIQMYRYHSALAETRWYSSAWWQWPLDLRPIWLYRGTVDIAPDRVASIVTMGNPGVWWAGTLAVPAAAVLAVLKRDRTAAWILVAFLCSYLPWAIGVRGLTFIYHFLPAVPFMILALAYCLGRLVERFPLTRLAVIAYLVTVALIFALFLPLLSGIPVPRAYAQAMQWLGSWIFFT